MAIVIADTVGSTANPPSASTLVKQSGGTFVIKCDRVRGRWKPHKVEETTGDGDANPKFEHNQMQNGYYTVSGMVVSGAEIGIEQLKTAANGTTSSTFKFLRESTSGAPAGCTQTVTAMVIDLFFDWSRGRVRTPLILQLLVTDTTPSSVEGTS
jgi:hypothetical protein